MSNGFKGWGRRDFVTVRMESSMGLFEESKFRNVDMALDQEEVSSVVVLCLEGRMGERRLAV